MEALLLDVLFRPQLQVERFFLDTTFSARRPRHALSSGGSAVAHLGSAQ
jgi:hypothetical protein